MARGGNWNHRGGRRWYVPCDSFDPIGVDNTGVNNASLYTQPEDIWDVYRTLAAIGPYFSIAAGFGNVHGVYKPGNVHLHPELLSKHQAFAKEQLKGKDEKPL